MKKVFLFLIVASVFTLASCKKDRTCTCTAADGSKTVTVVKKATKSGAGCYDYTTTSTSTYGGTTYTDTYSETCKLD